MLVKDAIKTKTKRYDVTLTEAVVTKDATNECIIAGYANTSTKDRVGDVVAPAAFEKSLPVYLKNPILLANHDWEDPIGSVIEAKIDEKGLWIKARISDSREDIKTLIREKCLRTFSIGYNEIDADYDEATKTKYVKELELLEISVVTVPANHEAMFDLYESKGFVEGLKKFVEEVQTNLGRDMNGSEVGAVCGYFIENKGEQMKTKELIDLLTKTKSAPAPTVDAAKADAEAAAPAAAQGDASGAAPDAMKELMSKLDAMAQGMAKVLEMLDKLGASEAAEEPAAEPAADEAKATEDKPKDEEEEMSEEDCAKAIAEIDAELEKLED